MLAVHLLPVAVRSKSLERNTGQVAVQPQREVLHVKLSIKGNPQTRLKLGVKVLVFDAREHQIVLS